MKAGKKKILILSGFVGGELEYSIQSDLKKPIEQSANQFQRKLIEGFRANSEICDVTTLSAPFVGSFPLGSRRIRFDCKQVDKGVDYVNFNNIWGLRNFSRAEALKLRIRSMAVRGELGDYVVVYCPHTPFLKAAAYAKKLKPGVKVCMIVPDLPQFMNLNSDRSIVYDFAKRFDIKAFERLNRSVDSYVLLTEEMTELLDMHGMPYLVREGISDCDAVARQTKKAGSNQGYRLYRKVEQGIWHMQSY